MAKAKTKEVEYAHQADVAACFDMTPANMATRVLINIKGDEKRSIYRIDEYAQEMNASPGFIRAVLIGDDEPLNKYDVMHALGLSEKEFVVLTNRGDLKPAASWGERTKRWSKNAVESLRAKAAA